MRHENWKVCAGCLPKSGVNEDRYVGPLSLKGDKMDAKELLQSFGRIVEELEKLSPDERERVIRAAMAFCEIRISQH